MRVRRFSAYRAKEDLKEKIGELKQAPVYDFVSEDGIGHGVWVMDDDSDVAMIEEAFGKIPRQSISRMGIIDVLPQ